MSNHGGPTSVPPFPPEYRASGLLLHVSPRRGIGDLGPSAFSWVDRLHDLAKIGGARSGQRLLRHRGDCC
jgi:hypothetical protein